MVRGGHARSVLEQYERSEPRRSERSELGQANHAARFTNVGVLGAGAKRMQ